MQHRNRHFSGNTLEARSRQAFRAVGAQGLRYPRQQRKGYRGIRGCRGRYYEAVKRKAGLCGRNCPQRRVRSRRKPAHGRKRPYPQKERLRASLRKLHHIGRMSGAGNARRRGKRFGAHHRRREKAQKAQFRYDELHQQNHQNSFNMHFPVRHNPVLQDVFRRGKPA